MDNLGAIGGPLFALGLVAALGTRAAVGLLVVPGLLATVAIVYANPPVPEGGGTATPNDTPAYSLLEEAPW